jgi:hypothetical protein
MTALILTPQQISVSLENKDGELRLDSRVVADGFGLKNHKDYRNQVLEKYENTFAELGGVLKTPLENGEIVWYLNQDQVNFAGTLARNTEKAVAFKLNLVKAFSIAKQVIPVQNDRIRELELINQNLVLRHEFVQTTATLVALHGEALGLAIAGFDGQVVEVRIPVTETLDPVTGNSEEFLDAKQLVKEVERRSGQKVKSNSDFIRKLRAANRDDLILPVTRNATCEYVRPEDLDEAIRVVYGTSKQMLLKPVGMLVKK